MLNKILGFFKKKQDDSTLSEVLTTVDSTTSVDENVQKDVNFENSYSGAKQVIDLPQFKKFIIELVMEKMSNSSYAPYKDFIYEIKYFLHYTFLVIEDDYIHGDKIFQKSITQLDNYIFSSYRKKPDLQKHIKKLCNLAYSKRFVDPPKENILSYFVFLEENGVEIIDILDDFSFVLKNGGKVPDWIFNAKEKILRKTYEKKENSGNLGNDGSELQTLHSVYSNFGEKTRLPRVDITESPLNWLEYNGRRKKEINKN